MEIIMFNNRNYPEYITEGHHSKFIAPLALEVCKGYGLDIGCGKKEWALPRAFPIDEIFDDEYNAFNLPLPSSILGSNKWDYIFSSHCLEHIADYENALWYWSSFIDSGGILFLYLPHYSCAYWRPELMPNKKHIHQFYAEDLKDKLEIMGYTNIFYSEQDLAYSFAIFGEKI